MHVLRTTSWIITVASLLVILTITLNYIVPPATDPSRALFLQGEGYLSGEESVGRDEIARAVTKLLASERQNYIRICYLAATTLIGLVGISVSRRPETRAIIRKN